MKQKPLTKSLINNKRAGRSFFANAIGNHTHAAVAAACCKMLAKEES
jgi:hypothetical protein